MSQLSPQASRRLSSALHGREWDDLMQDIVDRLEAKGIWLPLSGERIIRSVLKGEPNDD